MAKSSTREKLLMAALELFSKKGYSATSVDEIGAMVGVTGPSMYKYFKGKAALLDALNEMTEANYKKKMSMDSEKAPEICDSGSFKEFSLSQISFTMNDEKIVMLRKMYTIEQFRNESMAKAATLHQYANIVGLYTGIFKELMEKGLVEKDDPEFIAFEYISPISFLIQLADREPERKEEILKTAEKHVDHFIDRYFVRKGKL